MHFSFAAMQLNLDTAAVKHFRSEPARAIPALSVNACLRHKPGNSVGCGVSCFS
jgi:hypothetical protein